MAVKSMKLTSSDLRLLKTWYSANNPKIAMVERLPHLNIEFLESFGMLEISLLLKKFEDNPEMTEVVIPYIVNTELNIY